MLELPASHASVRVARNLVARFARMSGVPEGDVDSMRLVASELLANAVDHVPGVGSGGAREDAQASGRMGLALEIQADVWSLEVHDQGGGAADDIRALLGQELPDFENERGRGFFLLEQMLDVLEVRTSPDGRGLTLAARKSF
ncbi:MAG: ATP-binding protein [Planctomycetota bacterium]